MQPPAVGIEEGHDVKGHDLHVKCVDVFQVVVPNFVDNIMEKLGHTLLGCLVTGVVIKTGFMGSLRTNVNNHRGVVGDLLVVELERGWVYKFGTVVGFVLDGLGEDGHEGVNPIQLVIGDYHEKGEKGLPNGEQVIIGQLPFEGREGVMGLFEEASDHVGCHFG
jgi:hypothetical protein